MAADPLAHVVQRLEEASLKVLGPEQLDEPAEYVPTAAGTKPKAGGGSVPTGLHAYLTDKGSYLQVYELAPTFTASGVYDTYLLTVDALAIGREPARTLAAQARTLLSRTPRKGGYITTFQPERIEPLTRDVYRVTVQYEVRQVRTQE